MAARKLDRIAAEHTLLSEALASLDRAVIEAGEAADAAGQGEEGPSEDRRVCGAA